MIFLCGEFMIQNLVRIFIVDFADSLSVSLKNLYENSNFHEPFEMGQLIIRKVQEFILILLYTTDNNFKFVAKHANSHALCNFLASFLNSPDKFMFLS